MPDIRACSRVALFLVLPLIVASARASDSSNMSNTDVQPIHIFPVLSSPSVKNGQSIKVSAVVKAPAGVRSVTADFGGVETIKLSPETKAISATGIWSATWSGHDLQEKIYRLKITATDALGNISEDSSLEFSDPAAGFSTPGVNTYPNDDLAVARRDNAFLPTENSCYSVAYNPTTNMALFSVNGTPNNIVQVDMGSLSKAPVRVGVVQLNVGEINCVTAVVDTVNNVALFATDTNPSQVIKVAFGVGGAPPTRVGAVTLNAGENRCYSSVIDPASNQALFGMFTAPGIVVKISVNAANAAPTRVSALTLNAGESNLAAAVLDVPSGIALFGTYTSPGNAVKVQLNAIGSPPTRIGVAPFLSGENQCVSAVADFANGIALFGTFDSPGRIVKVAFGMPAAAPTRVGSLTLNAGENTLYSAAIDPANGVAVYASTTTPSVIVKVSLGAPAAAPTRTAAIPAPTGQNGPVAAISDPTNGRMVFVPFIPSNTQLLSVVYSPQGMLTGTKFTVAENAAVTDVHLFTHLSGNTVRLGIYDSAYNLLWQTLNPVATVAGAEIVVPISSGTPASIGLPPGTYYLAFQCSNAVNAPSFTAGTTGDGFVAFQDFGPFATLAAPSVTSTTSKFTEYLTYSQYQGAASVSLTTQDNPGVLNTNVTVTLSSLGGDPTLGQSYSVLFGDGSAPVTGFFAANGSADVVHVYTVPGDYTVSATVSDGISPNSLTLQESIPAPGAPGEKNVSDNTDTITNPLNNLKISVLNSNGGVIQLGIDVSTLKRDVFNVSTNFDDITGRSSVVMGIRPVHLFTNHGLFVATVSATDPATGALVGKGRKTLALSTRETAETLSANAPSGDAPSSKITTKSMKGKFVFSGTKTDAVSYSGIIKLPPGLNTAKPHELAIAIGNIVTTTTLDAKGTAAPKGALKKLKVTYVKLKKGSITKGGEEAKVDATISASGLIVNGFDTEGLSATAADATKGKKANRSIQIAVELEGVTYETLAPVTFSVSNKADSGTIAGRNGL